ncbi:MAG: hypothetical protein GY788_27635, partial [bacterium]|nr:hypothetical protein [bacterium]
YPFASGPFGPERDGAGVGVDAGDVAGVAIEDVEVVVILGGGDHVVAAPADDQELVETEAAGDDAARSTPSPPKR